MTRSNAFAYRFFGGRCCRWITVWWEPLTPPNRRDTYLVRNVDNSNAMDLADADNEVVAVDDEEVFYVSNNWSNASANSLAVR